MHIRQIALVARELEPAVSVLTDVLDLEVAYRDPGVGVFGLENAVMPVGETFLEVVSPVQPSATAGRFLEKRSDSGYMVIFETNALAADRRRVEALGMRVVWEIALDDISTFHLHPKDTGGAIVSLDQPKPAGAWRWGGPNWRDHVRTNRAERIVSAEIEADDPATMAARWASLLGLAEPRIDGKLLRVALNSGGELRFVRATERGEGLSAIGITTAARDQILAAAHRRGLAVSGDSIELCGIRIDLE
jgi:catechol 2,3-dioxygenase-like lactoylglutathione lyase family enzyme